MARVGREVFVPAITGSMRDDPGDFLHELNTLPLRLHCPECGDVNEYRVRRIAVEPADPTLDPLLAEDLACVSCGRWSDLACTAEARLMITGELLELVADRARGPAARSRVLVRPRVPLNGRVRPVGEVIAHCQAAVGKDPRRLGDWVRLAYCYQQVLARPRFAARFSDLALSLDPNAVEAVLLKADTLTVEGRDAEAFERLEQALASKDQWRLFLTDVASPAETAAQFTHQYNKLLHRLGRSDRTSLHASFLDLAGKKAGRNDPCPCGSGKKYKKCCLGRP